MPYRYSKSGSERLNNIANVTQLLRQLRSKHNTWDLKHASLLPQTSTYSNSILAFDDDFSIG